jgi:hypothetical protein
VSGSVVFHTIVYNCFADKIEFLNRVNSEQGVRRPESSARPPALRGYLKKAGYTGKSVVGFCDTTHYWNFVAKLLLQRQAAIVVDNAGHGDMLLKIARFYK